jgi:hypothetical protein
MITMTYFPVQLSRSGVTRMLDLTGLQAVGSACAVCSSQARPQTRIGARVDVGTSVVTCPGCASRI